MAKALELWSPEVIEEALGAGAEGVLPEAVRLIDLHVRLPRHQVAMLERFAERERTSVSSVLAQELDGMAGADVEELSWAVRGSRTRWRGPMRTARNAPAARRQPRRPRRKR
jgi:hypothetical protein